MRRTVIEGLSGHSLEAEILQPEDGLQDDNLPVSWLKIKKGAATLAAPF